MACLMIVTLRVAIGWQFLYEGIWKLNSQKGSRPWTAEPYLLNARGPFRSTFREMVPDPDGLDRLDYDKTAANWDNWYERFKAHHPDLTDEQKRKIETLLNGSANWAEPLAVLPAGVDLTKFSFAKVKAPDGSAITYDAKGKRLVANFHLIPAEKEQLLGLLPESASEEERATWKRAVERLYDRTSALSLKERLQVLVKEDPTRVGVIQETHHGTIDHKRLGDIDLYRNMIARYEANLKSAQVDFHHRHLDKLWAEMQEKKAGLVAPVDALTNELVTTAEKTLSAVQLTRGAVPPLPSQLAQANYITMYGLLILGALLMVGLFSRLSSLGAAGLLFLFYLAMPPWPGVPEPPGPEHSLIINKNLIECLACLMLATIPTGRWVGLDALIRRFIFRQQSD